MNDANLRPNNELPKAPDGGPVSKFYRPEIVQKLPTVMVRLKADKNSEGRIINRKDFDPELHEEVKIETPAPKPGREALTERELTREKLSEMTMASLKALPEYEFLDEPEKLTKKGDLIEALMAL